ncbi:GAF domain-containing protein [Microvirga splendida]|uniref:GAF domain-containing protein n=1 Tax=Microvirga splendida TaxID=2795727 RepID=A0ABS0Y0R8_9HYPH|nr:GAF domain-containing protein [Microvirga splendida]MBJ6125873.1 GAF domain-containing protein [Microvirga splendida]
MANVFPPNEVERLAALRRLGIIDAPASPSLDRICRVAQQLFNVPIAAVTFLDATQQWLKSTVGIGDLQVTAREHSFCQYTIMHDEVFVVPDAKADRVLATNPYVAGEPGVRFYAGAPLTTEPGIRLGSLCVIDTEPREFQPDQAAVLAGLGRLVVDELWLHHLERVGLAGANADSAPAGATPLAFDLTAPLTSEQIRAGRALLNWSVRELADASGISATTIKRIEAQGSDIVRKASIDAIRRAMEGRGIEFTASADAKVGLSIDLACK